MINEQIARGVKRRGGVCLTLRRNMTVSDDSEPQQSSKVLPTPQKHNAVASILSARPINRAT
jgi:hypothetical protein